MRTRVHRIPERDDYITLLRAQQHVISGRDLKPATVEVLRILSDGSYVFTTTTDDGCILVLLCPYVKSKNSLQTRACTVHMEGRRVTIAIRVERRASSSTAYAARGHF